MLTRAGLGLGYHAPGYHALGYHARRTAGLVLDLTHADLVLAHADPCVVYGRPWP